MDYNTCVSVSNNINELKRIASAYVEDSRRLDLNEIKSCLIKTSEQYTSINNIAKQIKSLSLNCNASVRIIVPIILQTYLLNEDDYISPCKNTEEAVLTYEQSVIDASNNFDIKNITKDLALYQFMLDKAWSYGGSISVDEKNLIEEVRKYLNISTDEHNMLEAKAGRYPTLGNVLHTRSEIDNARKILQAAGILFYVKNSDGVNCDIIPDEIANGLRNYYGIELKKHAYMQLIAYVTKLSKKQYLIDIINKFNENPNSAKIDMPINPTVSYLQDVILKSIKPSNLIGGFSPRDGLDGIVLSKWCGDLGLIISGTKPVLLSRLLKYYDELRKITITTEDNREQYYNCFQELAQRDLQTLRKNSIIIKDLECEHYFEAATNYLFEVKLKNKPLILAGNEHPDGKLSFNDKYVMWDNKSKETPVNLKDHIAQLDKYIRNSDKPVSVFMVIAPSFTDNSTKECVNYSLINDTLILLITAEELKELADKWSSTHAEESFNLGYFKQNGRFDKSLITF